VFLITEELSLARSKNNRDRLFGEAASEEAAFFSLIVYNRTRHRDYNNIEMGKISDGGRS